MSSIGFIVVKGSGDPDHEISEGPGLKKYFFPSFGAQFGLKIRGGGGGGPQGPPLGSTTEGRGPGGGKLELSNVRAVAGQRFILKES